MDLGESRQPDSAPHSAASTHSGASDSPHRDNTPNQVHEGSGQSDPVHLAGSSHSLHQRYDPDAGFGGSHAQSHVHEAPPPISDFVRPPEYEESPNYPSTTLRRSPYPVLLVLIYGVLSLVAWAFICILAFRPITTGHYGLYVDQDRPTGYPSIGSSVEFRELYVRNERYYHAARVIHAIVTVLAIPVASTVCAAAAVAYTQAGRSQKKLALRQLMILANRGWASVSTYGQLLSHLGRRSWKRYYSPFLLLATLLVILGAVIAPLQQIFLSSATIKRPSGQRSSFGVHDLAEMNIEHLAASGDDGFTVAVTRKALASGAVGQPQPYWWHGSDTSPECSKEIFPLVESIPTPSNGYGCLSLREYNLSESFFAEVPRGYNTGLIRQYLPRINSSATFRVINPDRFPQGCNDTEGAFFVDISNSTDRDAWHLQACMPSDMRKSPWNGTRHRQDFSETLYLKIAVTEPDLRFSNDVPEWRACEITMKTSAGYFELPNYMNGEVAGPLLQRDPFDDTRYGCGRDCVPQFGHPVYEKYR